MSACSSVEIVIPAVDPERAKTLAELAKALAPESGFAEIWVSHGRFPALCVLINGDRGWLMFVRHEGDPGFSSRNPRYVAPDAEIEFMFSNGQRNCYPAEWTYSRAEVIDSIRYFARTRHMPEGLFWFNDSGDRARSPNDGSAPHGRFGTAPGRCLHVA